MEGDNNFFDSVNPKELPFAIPPNSNTQLKLEENMSCLLCPGSKLTNTQGQTKLANSLGKQQLKVTVGLQGPILSKNIFYTKFKTVTLSEFSQKIISKT